MTDAGNPKMLVVKALRYAVNGMEILKGIGFEAHKGEFIGLIGPNGAGKTTLLKCINGINKGTGVIELKGWSLEGMNSRETACEVSLMHQNTTVSFPFTSMDIVMSGRYPHLKRLQGESKEDFRIAEGYMKYTDTYKFKDKPINQISGGERQRVLFAKALTQETDLLLLDEPAASLDIAHEEQIFKYCCELSASGRTIVAAVHDLKIAVRYCSRLLLMKEGEIIADGGPEEVLTSENLSRAYGVNALVYRNRITGMMDYYIHGMEHEAAQKSVHIIGGGGSASAVIRLLFENGCRITAGVFAHGDSDVSCAEIFGIDCLVCQPFSEISEESYGENVKRIAAADMTILCDMPFGIQNLRNLSAAGHARKLVIIEDSDPASRDFTGGKALEAYWELRKNAVVIPSARLHEVL